LEELRVLRLRDSAYGLGLRDSKGSNGEGEGTNEKEAGARVREREREEGQEPAGSRGGGEGEKETSDGEIDGRHADADGQESLFLSQLLNVRRVELCRGLRLGYSI